jgi:hypothetical protein
MNDCCAARAFHPKARSHDPAPTQRRHSGGHLTPILRAMTIPFCTWYFDQIDHARNLHQNKLKRPSALRKQLSKLMQIPQQKKSASRTCLIANRVLVGIFAFTCYITNFQF